MSQDAAPRRDGVLGGIGRACYRHRWLTLLSWILGVACLITLWTGFGAAPGGSAPGAADHAAAPGATLCLREDDMVSGRMT